MVVNTVQIPDITSEMLAAYPYAVILTDGTNFYLIMTAEGTLYTASGLVIPAGTYQSYSYAYGGQIAWTDNGIVTSSVYTFSDLQYAWTNHEIYTATTDDSGNYIASDEVSFGEAYMIPHGYPAIPANLLKDHPYAMITPSYLALSATPMYLAYEGTFELDLGLFYDIANSDSTELTQLFLLIMMISLGTGSGAFYLGITSKKTNPVIYEVATRIWATSDDEAPQFQVGMGESVVWANHDVKEAYFNWLAADDDVDGAFTLTDKLLVPKSMCMLPSDDWYEKVYPYHVMATFNDSTTSTDVTSIFLASPTPFYAVDVENGDISGSVFPNIDFSGEYYPPFKPNVPYLFAIGFSGTWMAKEEVYPGAYTPKAILSYYALMLCMELGIMLLYTEDVCLWSNHDIKLSVYDTSSYKMTATNEVAIEGTGAIIPENKSYEISREWLIQNAYFQRMLTGIEGEITPFDARNIGTAISDTKFGKSDSLLYSLYMEVPF